ncbi:uncharacterized protein LOC100201345 isoform X1 [Hydra vulgaris]|uniref:uncharacterized protein LOC100201345 isoform X1 n=1 Tax=Hydra vulgaris TaxID=6087 RepID=UPI001F5F7E82|nr:uncharacterized protein LOC100201345 [Hydra vulgaris]
MLNQKTEEIKCGIKEVKNSISNNNYKDQFVCALTHFSDKAYNTFYELLIGYSRMQFEFQEFVDFFKDDFTKTATEDFFGSFAIFLQHIVTTKDFLLKKEGESEGDTRTLNKLHFINCNTVTRLDNNIEKMSTNLINEEENVEFACLKEIKTNRMSVVKRAAKTDVETVSNYKNEVCDNYEMVYTKGKSVPKKPQRLSDKNSEKLNNFPKDNYCIMREENEELEYGEHSIDKIAAKLSAVPINGSFSRGKMKQIPFMTANAWPLAVDICPDMNNLHYEADIIKTETIENQIASHKDNEVKNCSNVKYLCREPINEVINDSVQLGSSDCSSTDRLPMKKTNTFSPLPWVSPLNSPVEQRKLHRSGEEMLNSIGISKSSNIKRTTNDITKSLMNNQIKSEPQINAKNAQLQLQDAELYGINNTLSFHTYKNLEDDYDNGRRDKYEYDTFTENIENPLNGNIEIPLNEGLKLNKIKLENNEKPFHAKNENQSSNNSSDINLTDLNLKKNIDSSEKLYRNPLSSSEHEEALNTSRQHQTNPVFIDLMKAKLNADRQRPVFKRKITDHEEPLYASVIKESLQEYESQRSSNIITKNENLSVQKISTPVDFMSILQKKFVEANPDIHNNIHDNPSQLAIAYEPIYADVLEKTLIDYEKEKNEHERVRKLGLAFQSKFINDDTIDRSSPNFFGILEDNMIENKLLFADDSDSFNQKDEPICALVIKAALKWYRKTVIHQKSSKVKVGQASSLSRSPSDASSTSEEVRIINTSIMDSSPQVYLSDSELALPKIPSPDYTCSKFHVSDVFYEKDVEKKVESYLETSGISNENFFLLKEKTNNMESHPYHIDRPFWNETENNDSLKNNNTKRSSLKKKPSDIKPNSVSFFKNVEVFNENDELNEKEVVRKEEPLKGSPQIDKKNEKRKKTPYSEVSPIDKIFYEADLEIHKKKKSVDNLKKNTNQTHKKDETPSQLHSNELPNLEELPVVQPLISANLIENKPIILNIPDNAGVMQSVELSEEDLQDIAKEHNISLEELKGGSLIYNLLFDLITTTYPNGKVTTKLVPQGQGEKFVNDILLKEKLREPKFPVLPSANTPPPLVNRLTKPKNISRSPIIPANSMDFDIRHGKDSLIRTIIPSPDYLDEVSEDTEKIIDLDLLKETEKKLKNLTYNEIDLKEVNEPFVKSINEPVSKSAGKKLFNNATPLSIEKNLIKLSIEYENPEYSSDSIQNINLKNNQPIAYDNKDLIFQSANQSVSRDVNQSIDQVKYDKVFKTIGRNDHNPDYNPDYEEDYCNEDPPQLPDRSKKPVKKSCLVVTPVSLPPPSPMPHSPKCKDQLIIAKFSPVLR